MPEHLHKNQHCPLCEQANQCALAANESAQACWCQQFTFTDELLRRVTNTQAAKRCICKNCAEKSQQLATPAK